MISAGSPTADTSTEAVWDTVRVLKDPDACDCHMEDCESKAVLAVWTVTRILKMNGGHFAKNKNVSRKRTLEAHLTTSPVQSHVHYKDRQKADSSKTDEKELEEAATVEQWS